MSNNINWVIIIILSLISGFLDSKGFFFASQIWIKGNFHSDALIKSGAAFAIGLFFYWSTVYFMNKVGLNATELQVGLWFFVVIVGVALASGNFIQWHSLDKLVALVTTAGFLFLLIRNGN